MSTPSAGDFARITGDIDERGTGRESLAVIQSVVNVGSKETEGIDYAINRGFDPGWGSLEFGLRGTYMIKSESSLTDSSLGKFGADDAVVFRNIINVEATLYHGNFTHDLFLDYRSGHDDQAQEVEVVQPVTEERLPRAGFFWPTQIRGISSRLYTSPQDPPVLRTALLRPDGYPLRFHPPVPGHGPGRQRAPVPVGPKGR